MQQIMEEKDEANRVVVRSSEKVSREKEGKENEKNHNPLPLMALTDVASVRPYLLDIQFKT
jgi:hypothetical protein